jgi:hypothetical protein
MSGENTTLSSSAKINTLLELTYRLIQVLQQETDFLRKQDVVSIVPLQESKNILFQAYEKLILEFQSNLDWLQEISAEQKQHLAEVMAIYGRVTKENKNALRAARDSRLFVLEAIRNAVTEQQSPLTAYNRSGKTQRGVYRHAGVPQGSMSVALNQSL